MSANPTPLGRTFDVSCKGFMFSGRRNMRRRSIFQFAASMPQNVKKRQTNPEIHSKVAVLPVK